MSTKSDSLPYENQHSSAGKQRSAEATKQAYNFGRTIDCEVRYRAARKHTTTWSDLETYNSWQAELEQP